MKLLKNETLGFTIGKFAPLHKGHQFLLETGLQEMDHFVVIVYETDVIDIPIETRAKWIQELYPQIEIRFAKNPPKQYGLDPESVAIQMEYLTTILKDLKPTHFYSSEPYGKEVANWLHIIDRRIDSNRKQVTISGTQIRNNIQEHKKWLETQIYQDCMIQKNNLYRKNKINP